MFQRTLNTSIIFGLRTPKRKAPIKYLEAKDIIEFTYAFETADSVVKTLIIASNAIHPCYIQWYVRQDFLLQEVFSCNARNTI